MIKTLNKTFKIKVKNVLYNEASHLYLKKKNLEILIDLNSLKKYQSKIISMCGKLNKGKYYKLSKKNLYFDLILAGRHKLRIIDFKKKIVTSIAKDANKNKAIFDAKIRLKYPIIPAPKVFNIKEDKVTEQLIINTNQKEYLLTHPKDALLALKSMLPVISKHCEQRKNGRHYSITHGQLYKNDHVLKNEKEKIFLVDWSEGGHKDKNAKSEIFFDVISCIKWCLLNRRFYIYYYFRYINSFLELIFIISKKSRIINFKTEALETIKFIESDNKNYLKKLLYKNLKKKIVNYDN